MIKRSQAGLIALFIVFSGAFQAGAASLHLGAHEIATAGIKTLVLRETKHAPELAAQGTVLNPAVIMQTQSRLASAAANVAAAQAEMIYASEQATQNHKLYSQGHNISRSSLQQSIAVADQAAAALTTAKAKLATENTTAVTQWGATMTRAMQNNAPIIGNIANGTVSVIGVSLFPGTALAHLPAAATADFAGRTYRLTLIGSTPGMLGGVPGEALLYRMQAQPDLPIGTYLNVRVMTGPGVGGVMVPANAIVWENGKATAYLAGAGGSFRSVDLSTAFPVDGGYFIANGLRPGERIVTQGAELLAAAPTTVKAKAATADPDDD